MQSIYIVEDHAIMRRSLIALISNEEDLEVCGAAASAEEALQELPHYAPDLVVVDISLPGMSGLELLGQLAQFKPGVACLMVSGHNEDSYGQTAHQLGARGYVSKYEVRKIIPAIHTVLQGNLCFSEQILSPVERSEEVVDVKAR